MANEKEFMQEQGITDDSLAETTKETMLANMNNDVRAYEKSLQRAISDKANYEEQLVVDKQMWDILRKKDSIKRIVPLFNYELDPAWNELQQEKQNYKLRMDEATAEQAIKQYEDQISNIENALGEAKARLAKFSE